MMLRSKDSLDMLHFLRFKVHYFVKAAVTRGRVSSLATRMRTRQSGSASKIRKMAENGNPSKEGDQLDFSAGE